MYVTGRPVLIGTSVYCKLMILLCVYNSAALKVDAATQTDAADDDMKTEIISTEPIVSSGRKQWN